MKGDNVKTKKGKQTARERRRSLERKTKGKTLHTEVLINERIGKAIEYTAQMVLKNMGVTNENMTEDQAKAGGNAIAAAKKLYLLELRATE